MAVINRAIPGGVDNFLFDRNSRARYIVQPIYVFFHQSLVDVRTAHLKIEVGLSCTLVHSESEGDISGGVEG